MTASTPGPAADSIADWCVRHLGSAPVHSFITTAPASQLWGFELADGRVVAVKVRPASERLAASALAHRLAHDAGVGCPTPLAGPEPMRGDPGLTVAAETWRGDGAIWPAEDPAGSYGRLQARIVRACQSVDPAAFAPPPPRLHYDHDARDRLWPEPQSERWNLERVARDLPAGLERLAEAARERLLACRLPEVVGHGDLNGAHVRWTEGTNGVPEAVVHGWDEVAARPEAVLAGAVATYYNELPDVARIAPVAQGRHVLAAYQAARGSRFTPDEIEVAWAASTWVACFNAALEHLAGAAGQVTHQIMTDGALRLRLAGC